MRDILEEGRVDIDFRDDVLEYSIPVRDPEAPLEEFYDATEFQRIDYCPWCGKRLTLGNGALYDCLIAEIENPEYAENEDDRVLQTRRFGFYTRNGCSDTGLRVRCFGVPFMILRWGKKENEDLDALWDLYQSFYRIMLPKDLFKKSIKPM